MSTSGFYIRVAKRAFGFTSGATDASGNVTVDLTSAGFTAAPAIGLAVGPTANADIIEARITALSATSVTFNVQQSVAVTVLSISVLAAKTPAAGVVVQFVAAEK